jgi:DNA-binding FrmR family transcriptional regulator
MRLKRIEGQLRGVQKMIEGGEDCELIAQQLSAGRKALDKAFFELLACAIEHPQFSPDPKQGTPHSPLARTLANSLTAARHQPAARPTGGAPASPRHVDPAAITVSDEVNAHSASPLHRCPIVGAK